VHCVQPTTRFWDGDQILSESRSDELNTSGPFVGTFTYLHAGGIDQPLLIWKSGSPLAPFTNWQGYYVGGYSGGQIDGGTWPGRYRDVFYSPDARVTQPDLDEWRGSLLEGMVDASGLVYKRNRYYDPQKGQFTQIDPIGIAGGLNLYGFAGGDPVSFDDPFGLCCFNTATHAVVAKRVTEAVLFEAIKSQWSEIESRWNEGVRDIASLMAVGGGLQSLAAGAAAAGASPAGRVALEAAKQGKHIPGHNNFIAGRSIFTHSNPQGLLDKFAGTGQRVAGTPGQPGFKERVDFGQVIGQVNVNGDLVNTTRGIIHHAKGGAHIVPANP
jgi:RHS repeat-associated protein